MISLPDVNVWIALTVQKHVLHRAAHRWFTSAKEEKLVFCRITQAGFLRLLSNRHVMQDEAMTPDQAWQTYRILRSDRRVGYLSEPAGLPEIWDTFTRGSRTAPNLWTDAYLCAFAHAANLTFVTFDSGIPQRPDTKTLVLAS